MASVLVSITPKHEYLIKCPIVKVSGGGTIYRCTGNDYPCTAGLVYKHVTDQSALNALTRIFESIRGSALPDIETVCEITFAILRNAISQGVLSIPLISYIPEYKFKRVAKRNAKVKRTGAHKTVIKRPAMQKRPAKGN